MKNYIQIFALLAITIIFLIPSLALAIAAERPKQPPSALEALQLRSKCVELGRRVLAAKVDKEAARSLVSHYNFQDKRCYVMVTVWAETFENHALYDGQSQEMLAIADVATLYNWVDKGGVFGQDEGNYDKVCAYINEKMEENHLCADLSWWWVLQQAGGRKPSCDLGPCR